MSKPLPIIALCIVAGLATACTPDKPAPLLPQGQSPTTRVTSSDGDELVASVNGRAITRAQLNQALLESNGLSMLQSLVQLELLKQEAARTGVVVTPDNVKAEYDLTFTGMFENAAKTDYPALFEQFLDQRHMSKTEWDLLMQNNAYLRKLAEPAVAGKITDDGLQEAFSTLYGEKVQVRHIALNNMQEVAEARRRLAAGQKFEKVAQDLSHNERTAALGGEIPPFSRSTPGYPQAFKDTAFGLKVGEVSDPVQADEAFHIIKLEARIAPKVVKFEDVKESIREDLNKRLLTAAMNQMRRNLGALAIQTMKIVDPTLNKQWQDKVSQQEQKVKDETQIREQMERDRAKMLTEPATNPTLTTRPATLMNVTPATMPATAQPEALRPPATRPEATTTSPGSPPNGPSINK